MLEAASMPPFKSRLSFYCLRCKHVGDRSDCFVSRRRQTPCYEDLCPYCGSDDVEVYDSRYSKPSDELELANMKAITEGGSEATGRGNRLWSN